MFQSHAFIEPAQEQSIIEPKNYDRYQKVWQDYGPVAIQDVTEGLTEYLWELRWSEGWWYIFRIDSPDTTIELLTDTGLETTPEFADITFDTAGRAQVVWEVPEGVNLFWYDPTVPGYTTTLVAPEGKNPFCTLDLRSLQLQVESDTIITYERDNAVYYRITNERYTVEYPTPITDLGNKKIFRAGVGINWRYTILVA